MTDSPMIRVLKYLEAGNDLILPVTGYRKKKKVVRLYQGQVNLTTYDRIYESPQFWEFVSDLRALDHWAQYLPKEPEQPAYQTETRHVRKVEL